MTKEHKLYELSKELVFQMTGNYTEDVQNSDFQIAWTYLNKAMDFIHCFTQLPSRIEIDSEITDILGRYALGAKPTPKQDELNDIEKGFRICVEWLKNR